MRNSRILSDFNFSALVKLAALPVSAVARSSGHFGFLFFLFDGVCGCRAHGRRQRPSCTMETRAFARDPSFLGVPWESGGTGWLSPGPRRRRTVGSPALLHPLPHQRKTIPPHPQKKHQAKQKSKNTPCPPHNIPFVQAFSIQTSAFGLV